MNKLEVLKQEMDRLDLDQKDLAELMHVSRSTICRRLKNPTDDFFKGAAVALNSTRLKMLVFGDTTESVFFDKALINDKSTLDRMQQEARELIEAIQELKENMNYHNVTNIEDCDKELKQGYMKVAEQNKDVNHCSEHLDIALDDLGVNLKERDKNCVLKYLDRGYISADTKIKSTSFKGASAL